jgi:hypothetical protein
MLQETEPLQKVAAPDGQDLFCLFCRICNDCSPEKHKMKQLFHKNLPMLGGIPYLTAERIFQRRGKLVQQRLHSAAGESNVFRMPADVFPCVGLPTQQG